MRTARALGAPMLVARVLAVLLLAALMATASPARAADRCESLAGELSRLAGGGSKSATYAAAARKQQAALDQARREAAAGGCNGFALTRPAGCRAFLQGIARMEANLASLQAMAGGAGSADRRRRDVQARMAAAGCTDTTREARTSKPARTETRAAAAAGKPAGGSFRTLCVRMCDGYYFPISWSARRQHLPTDEAMCRARCPRAEVSLYVHPTGTESETAMSLAGEPYTALPNAFRYRSELDQTCGCGQPFAAVTELKPTVATMLDDAPAGPGLLAEMDLPSLADTTQPHPTPVRRVGPASLYDQLTAAARPSPARDPAR